MAINIDKFVSGVIGVVVAVIVVVVIAIPIISANEVAESVANADALNSMLAVIPLLIVVGIIMAVVGTFLYSKSKN